MRLSLDKNLGDRRVATETRVDSKTQGWCDGLADLRDKAGESRIKQGESLSFPPPLFLHVQKSTISPAACGPYCVSFV